MFKKSSQHRTIMVVIFGFSHYEFLYRANLNLINRLYVGNLLTPRRFFIKFRESRLLCASVKFNKVVYTIKPKKKNSFC